MKLEVMMFHLFGSKECIKSLYSFTTAVQKEPISTFMMLRDLYAQYWLPPGVFALQKTSSDAGIVSFKTLQNSWGLNHHESIYSTGRYEPKPELFCSESVLNNMLLQFKSESPDLWDIFCCFVRVVTSDYGVSCNSGTRSSKLGVIVVNQRKTFGYIDFSEMCVHELCHTILFIDEFVRPYCHPDDALNAMFQSAIRKTKRPLRPAFHSLVVNAEILLYRYATNTLPKSSAVHGDTPSLLSQLVASISDFEARPSLLNMRGHAILQQIRTSLTRIGLLPAHSVVAA